VRLDLALFFLRFFSVLPLFSAADISAFYIVFQ
jgi:hypothetical protein